MSWLAWETRAYLGALVVGLTLSEAYRSRSGHEAFRRTKAFWITLLAAIGAACLNPHGPAILLFPMNQILNRSMRQKQL